MLTNIKLKERYLYELDIKDTFFDSLRLDYKDFNEVSNIDVANQEKYRSEAKQYYKSNNEKYVDKKGVNAENMELEEKLCNRIIEEIADSPEDARKIKDQLSVTLRQHYET